MRAISDSPIPLSAQQVAEMLAISREVVYRLCESGKLAHHRFGNGRGTIRIFQQDLDQFIASSRVHTSVRDLVEYDHLA
ncbi:helix-turn-helix domain-containing protein [Bythopirellula goksoeyrii]